MTTSATTITPLHAAGAGNQYSFWRRFLRAYFRNAIAAVGLLIVTVMLIAALTAPFIAPYNPNKTSVRDRLQPPGTTFFLGTDDFGRDIFSRLLHGAGFSLRIAIFAQLLTTLIGVSLGLISGWYGGRVDDLIMFLAETSYAVPGIIFLIIWVSLLGLGRESIFLALALIGWSGDARMVRAQVLSLKEREYVVAARAMGASPARIMALHLLPNCLAPTIVLASLGIAGVILAESGLSFLGVGVQIPDPSWGSMIKDGGGMLTSAWWYSIFPGLAIMLAVLGFNFMGDGLRDALDPRQYE
ncbi:MAG: ABC transporter permease [Anaerolineae bacterium]|nr:ABC transporter permease [Anaerolineae bacterium]